MITFLNTCRNSHLSIQIQRWPVYTAVMKKGRLTQSFTPDAIATKLSERKLAQEELDAVFSRLKRFDISELLQKTSSPKFRAFVSISQVSIILCSLTRVFCFSVILFHKKRLNFFFGH